MRAPKAKYSHSSMNPHTHSNLSFFSVSAQHSLPSCDQCLQRSRWILFHQRHFGHPPVQRREEETRRWYDTNVFAPRLFNSPHHSSCIFFSCVQRSWHLWQRCSQECFCVLSPVTCYGIYQAGWVLRKCLALQFTIQILQESCISIWCPDLFLISYIAVIQL